jgi:hypothetical protein
MKKKLLILGIALFLIAIVVGVAFAATCANRHCIQGHMYCNGSFEQMLECRRAGHCTANSSLGDCRGAGMIPCPNRTSNFGRCPHWN